MPNYRSILALAVAALPAAGALLFGWLSLRLEGQQRLLRWIVARRRLRILTILLTPAWLLLLAQDKYSILESLLRVLLPFAFSILVAELISISFDRNIFRLRWTAVDIARLSFWSTLAFPVPLLAALVALDGANEGNLAATFLLLCAGLTALGSRIGLRFAEGIRPHKVKSGELYKRALSMSRRMGIRLDSICIVPCGRGHLTNAFGLGFRSIAITEDYGRWSDGDELDFVIAHEIAHLQHKHAWKQLLGVVTTATGLLLLEYALPRPRAPWNVASTFALAIVPLLAYFYVSRRFELAADRVAAEAIQRKEVGIQALENLYGQLPAAPPHSLLEETFSTHPAPWRRTAQIASLSRVSDNERRIAVP